ncbi:MAG: hypothetical protein JST91_28200 [Actinobacteria bacterium]|nr:hypothetical protein [Actinomycetota bacterium]
MSDKVCKDCRSRQPVTEFPTDKWGRPDTRQCLQCVDEHTPLLMTRAEAARHLGITQNEFDRLSLPVVGTYSPPNGVSVALFARTNFPTQKAQVEAA